MLVGEWSFTEKVSGVNMSSSSLNLVNLAQAEMEEESKRAGGIKYPPSLDHSYLWSSRPSVRSSE